MKPEHTIYNKQTDMAFNLSFVEKRMNKRSESIEGKSFGSWFVLRDWTSQGKDGNWKCLARDSSGVEKEIRRSHLKSGKSKGSIEKYCDRGKETTQHPLWVHFRQMHHRVSYTGGNRYHVYGGKGVKVCSSWSSFDSFINYIKTYLPLRKDGQSLDRIDNNGDYAPGNVRWASPQLQANNRSTTVSLNCNKVLLTVSEISLLVGVKPASIRHIISKHKVETTDDLFPHLKKLKHYSYIWDKTNNLH